MRITPTEIVFVDSNSAAPEAILGSIPIDARAPSLRYQIDHGPHELPPPLPTYDFFRSGGSIPSRGSTIPADVLSGGVPAVRRWLNPMYTPPPRGQRERVSGTRGVYERMRERYAQSTKQTRQRRRNGNRCDQLRPTAYFIDLQWCREIDTIQTRNQAMRLAERRTAARE